MDNSYNERLMVAMLGHQAGTGQRTVHAFVEESAAATLTFNRFHLPIKEQSEAFFITYVKYHIGLPEDTPAIDSTEITKVGLQTVAATAMADWSQPQTVDMFSISVTNFNNISYCIDRNNGEPYRWVGELFPYNKMSICIESTNSATPAYVHARIYGVVIPINHNEFAWLCNNFTRWGRGNVAFQG